MNAREFLGKMELEPCKPELVRETVEKLTELVNRDAQLLEMQCEYVKLAVKAFIRKNEERLGIHIFFDFDVVSDLLIIATYINSCKL